MKLQDYFTPEGQSRALAAYASFAKGSAWSVPLKMDLYDLSRRAFVERLGTTEGFSCFERIYENLASYWQVFRPKGRGKCWTARQIYDALLAHFDPWSQPSGARLRKFGDAPNTTLVQQMRGLAGMKPGSSFPTMTVSKFLHFFNPRLFPIYDWAIIENRVMRRFKEDYLSFCSASGLRPKAAGEEFLHIYMLWGSRLLREAHGDFMIHFYEWLGEELPPKTFRELDPSDATALDATAFEFTAIGAAFAETPAVNKPCRD